MGLCHAGPVALVAAPWLALGGTLAMVDGLPPPALDAGEIRAGGVALIAAAAVGLLAARLLVNRGAP